MCHIGLGKLEQKVTDLWKLEKSICRSSPCLLHSGACGFHPVLTHSEPYSGVRSRASCLPWIMSQIATARIEIKNKGIPIFSDLAGE